MSTPKVIHADCLDAMRELPDASVGAIVTDPPYGLSFMGKGWDHGVPGEDYWREVLRVAKPGAHLAAFGGTRTYHRLACAIEDAGWEIRDCLMWLYGSGFPKSLDVSKAIDKEANRGGLAAAVRSHVRYWRDQRGLSNRDLNIAVGSSTTGCGMARHWTSTVGGQHALPSKSQWAKLRSVLGWAPCELDEVYEAIKDGAARPVVGEYTVACDPFGQRPGAAPGKVTAPATDAAREWQGYGTALKPAWEPIILARKPLAGTVAANVLEHGVGAINVDACRVGTEERQNPPSGLGHHANLNDDGWSGVGRRPDTPPPVTGRWPANVILDPEAAALLDEQSGIQTDGVAVNRNRTGERPQTVAGVPRQVITEDMGYGGAGGASRFFYCAKASAADRAAGNKHPTVKPADLMGWLVRLITPPGETVLDPFAGSGSTGVAAMRESRPCILIEREAEYVEVIRGRLHDAMPLFAQGV